MKEYSFSELRNKRIINVSDGRELGHLCDIVFSCTGRIICFVAPGKKNFFRFNTNDCVYIPWNCIIKVGEDVILVELSNRSAIMNTVDSDYEQSEYAKDNCNQNN